MSLARTRRLNAKRYAKEWAEREKKRAANPDPQFSGTGLEIRNELIAAHLLNPPKTVRGQS